MKTQFITTALDAIALPEAKGAPEWLRLFPKGKAGANDPRGPWHYDDAAALIQRSFDAPGRIHVDLDHSSLPGKQAADTRAYGYVTAMEEREDGIYGQIDWTKAGTALMEDRAYWGVSPVLTHDKKTGLIGRIISVALTNGPALRELTALNAEMENGMDFLKKVAEMLGLPADASEEDVTAALKKAMGEEPTEEAQAAMTALSQVRTALGAGETASTTELVATATALRAGGSEATDQVAALQAQLTTLIEAGKKRDAEAWIAGLRADKIGVPTGDLEQQLVALHMENPERAKKLVAGMPFPKLAASTLTANPPPPDTVSALSAEAKAVARQMGLTDDQMLEAMKADGAEKEAV